MRKFATLTAAHNDATAMARAAEEALNVKLRELSAYKRHQHEALEAVKSQRARPDDPQLALARKRVAALEEEVAELQQAAEARRQRAEPITKLFNRASAFLDACPVEALAPAPPAAGVKLGKNEPESEAVERLRLTIGQLNAQIRAIGALPRARTDMLRQIADEVAALVEAGRPNLAGVISGNGRIEWPERMMASGYHHRAFEIGVWRDPEGYRRRLEEELTTVSKQDGPTAEERAAKVADLDRQKLLLERQEEALLERLQERGFSVVRRPDADIRAVLALSDRAPVAGY
jgi:hypothetical protein